MVALLQSIANTTGKKEEVQSIAMDFQNTIDRTKQKQRSLESMNISAYEQSYQIINCKYELYEVFFKPLAQLATYVNEDLGTAVRQVVSSLGRLHDISQAYLSAALEMGGDGGGAGSLTKPKVSSTGVDPSHSRVSSTP